MRFLSFRRNGEERPGIALDNGRVVDLFTATKGEPAPISSIAALIAAGDDALEQARGVARRAAEGALDTFELAPGELLAAIPHPRKNIFCVGRNYAAHVAEAAKIRNMDIGIPEYPQFFTKPTTAVAAPNGVFRLDPKVTQKLDYEVELGIVIGRTGRNITEEKALDHVFGYTIVNDISARDLQFRHGQWFKGKGLDGACPYGPWIAHHSIVGDPQTLDISLSVNGETRQHSNTRHMIFTVKRLVSELSLGITLEPGDIIATGTPEGVGIGMDPPRFLGPGDVVECRIERIGSFTTRIIEAA